MKVQDILRKKGEGVLAVAPSERVEFVAGRLRLERVGALVVLSADGKLLGVVTERDIVRGLVDHGPRALGLAAQDLMRTDPDVCAPQDTIARAARIMTEKRIRHLPVVEAGQLRGLVSIGDVVRHRLEEMEIEAGVLRDMAAAMASREAGAGERA